jgi:hypothetical protein
VENKKPRALERTAVLCKRDGYLTVGALREGMLATNPISDCVRSTWILLTVMSIMWCAFLSRVDAPSLQENHPIVKIYPRNSLNLYFGVSIWGWHIRRESMTPI